MPSEKIYPDRQLTADKLPVFAIIFTSVALLPNRSARVPSFPPIAKAFKNLGYDKIPVVIEGSTSKDRRETKDVFPTSIQSDDGGFLRTQPADFYSVISKEKLFEIPKKAHGGLIDKPLTGGSRYI